MTPVDQGGVNKRVDAPDLWMELNKQAILYGRLAALLGLVI